MERPRARTGKLIERRVGDELLVYDLSAHRAHRLNEAAALVWQRCDGTLGPAELGALVGGQEAAESALSQLNAAGLLETGWSGPSISIDRRVLLKRAAVAAALAAPLVATIHSPSAVQAQSVCNTCVDKNACSAANCACPCDTPDCTKHCGKEVSKGVVSYKCKTGTVTCA